MDKKIKIGIMGVGMIGDVHIKNIRKDGRGEVIWIASRTQKTLDRKMKKYGISQGTLDYREILQDPQVEAVIIASPPHTHTEMTLATLEAGKHLLLEKPMAISYEGIRQITEAVKKHPQQLVLECSCRHTRLQPKYPFIKNIIDSGKLGKVYHIHHHHLMRRTFIEYNPAGKWSLEKQKAGGGPFLDQGVYDLSFHLGLLGDVPNLTSIKSFTKKNLKTFPDKNIHQDIEEHGAAYMEFEPGLSYYYERGAGVHCDIANETRICGTKGGLRFGFNSWDPPIIEYFSVNEKNQEISKKLTVDMADHEDNYALITHFLDCLIEGTKPQMTPDLAAKHLDILFRILNTEK